MSRHRPAAHRKHEPGTQPARTVSDDADRPGASVFPSLSELLEPRGPFFFPLLTLLVARILFAIVLPLASEDAYITFRYARSLAQGFGLVYNPGERVLGFTSPPWTLWCALGLKLGVTPVLWTRISSLLADAVTLLVFGRMLRTRFGLAPAACFTIFFAAWPFFTAAATSGMENSAMLALIALGAALAGGGSPVAGPVLGLLAAWRPEGVVAALVLALGASGRDRLVALAVAAAAYAGLAVYFGSPVAQSALAKAKLYGTPGPWAGRFWWDWLSPFLLGAWPRIAETSNLYSLVVIYAPALVVGASAVWRERRSAAAFAIAAALAVWAGYALTGAAYFFWYMVVPLGGFAALFSIGFPRIVRGRAIPITVGLFVVGLWTVAPYLYIGRAQNEYYRFAAAARVLRDHARRGDSVMLEPIGIIGWECPLVVIDEIGLVSPDVMRRRLQGAGWYADLVASRQPAWLVVRKGVVTTGEAFAGAGRPFRDAAERDATFARYALVEELEPQSGPSALQVWQRTR